MLYGRGEQISKRALNPAQPMNTAGISRGTARVKDPILPLVAGLAERHLA
ncbi:MAG: hypothetical protein HPY69_07010 [Armatimonadetes bacterium]|nr:hypothetical protein [Armatimonadota bacterium]